MNERYNVKERTIKIHNGIRTGTRIAIAILKKNFRVNFSSFSKKLKKF